MSSARSFFDKIQQEKVQNTIAKAEKATSGEIRVFVDNRCEGDAVKKAIGLFEKLKMHKTAQKNGVLFYLAVKSQKFAVVGDKGINDVVPVGFWDNIKEQMQQHFVKGEFTEGLCIGIQMAGEKLKHHFPFQKGDTNELSNEMSFGKN